MPTDWPSQTARKIGDAFGARRDLLLPAAVLGLLVVLVVPLPAALLDLLLVANIAIASLMLINAITQRKALEFSSFPALLLGTTLLRLVLNIASTRLILGADASSPAAVGEVAGAVISGFGGFVAGGSLIVGFIIFAILVIVQFVVITKGATRMSEVTARFTLDAMPGKQMAIDADLSAGLIDEQEATRRRGEITAEADFYGAMDGASKFVRGDAVAGLIITGINLVGGILVGVWLKGWTFAETASAFTRLTIGDGLAAQVPAFLIATAAGMLIARGGDEGTISDRIPEQLVARPKALLFISAFLGLLAMTPLPTVPLLAGALGLGFVAWAGRDAQVEAQRATEKATPQEAPASEAVTPERLAQISELQIDLGTALLGLAGADGPIVMGIGQQRNRIAAEFGLILPGVSVRDDQALRPREYRIRLRGESVGRGEIHPRKLMAIPAGPHSAPLDGVPGRDPCYGLDAMWIDPERRTEAEAGDWTVVEAASVLTVHLHGLALQHADEILTRQAVADMVEDLKTRRSKLVEETIPAVVKLGELQAVLQRLLAERVPILDLERIVETLGDWAPHTKDPDVLLEYVRNALGRTISARLATDEADGTRRIRALAIAPELEAELTAGIERSGAGIQINLAPDRIETIARGARDALPKLLDLGYLPVVVASPSVRLGLVRILESHRIEASVVGFNEIDRSIDLESVGLISCDQPTAAERRA